MVLNYSSNVFNNFNYLLVLRLLVISCLGFFTFNVIFLWRLLEIYNIFFIVLIFLKNTRMNKVNFDFLVYFGVVQLLRRVGLLMGLLLRLDLWAVMMLLVKMGSFPLNDWVVNFFCNVDFFSGIFFFSVKKVLPLLFLHDFLSLNFLFSLLIILFNWVICFINILRSVRLRELIGWSSIVRNGYFLFILKSNKKGLVFFILLMYFFFLYLIYYFIKKFNFFNTPVSSRIVLLFLSVVILFGVPPISMFLFKVSFFVSVIQFYSFFWKIFFLLVFFFLGVGYFIFFLNLRILIQDYNFLFLLNIISLPVLKIFIILLFLLVLVRGIFL